MTRPFIVAVLLLAGCAEKQQYAPRIVVEGDPPRIYRYTEDGTRIIEHRNWYSAEHLDHVVREYVRENEVDFDFAGTEPQFWIPMQRDHLADVTYSSGFYRPILLAKIGWDGYVSEHSIGTAVEGPLGEPDDGGNPWEPDASSIP